MDEKARTVWAGNLSERVTEDLLYELFLQAGPLEKVKIATDKDGRSKHYAFITFKHECSVPYAIELMNGISLFRNPMKLQNRTGSANDGMGSQGSPYNSPHHLGNQQAAMNPLQRSNTWHGNEIPVGGNQPVLISNMSNPVWNLPNMQPQSMDPLNVRRDRILRQQNARLEMHQIQVLQRAQQQVAMNLNPYGRQNNRPWTMQPSPHRRY